MQLDDGYKCNTQVAAYQRFVFHLITHGGRGRPGAGPGRNGIRREVIARRQV